MYKKENLKGYLYITPAFILLGLIVVFPIIYTFYISLTNMNIYHWFDFKVIGLENYKRALFVFNSGFLKALFLTVIWTIVNMVLQLVIAYLVATLLNSKLLKISKSIYRTLLIIPWAIPGYISILVWKTGMYNVEFGLFNQWLAIIGINKVEWLNYPFLAFISMTVVNLWLALPFMTIIMDGAFQSIDNAYYEVADIEGANFFQKSIYITIPLIKKIIGPAVIITMFTTFKQFDIFYLMTLQPSSRTGAGLQTIITFAYENAFITNNYGFSAAVSMIVFIMLILITLFTTNDFRRNRNEKKI